MDDNYDILNEVKGYITKSDPTNLKDPSYLVAGSQNMLINTDGKVVTRAGYELFASAASGTNPVKSEYVWKNNRGDEYFFREVNGTLQYYDVDSLAFETLLTGLSTTYPVRFTTYWNITEVIDVLAFVNHSAILYEWSGARGTLSSVASGTITINETIATEGFFSAGTRSIRIKDTGGTWRETAYTGESGSDFTVSTDLSGYTFATNAPVVQVVRTNANTPASDFTNDTIKTIQNQLVVGSESSRRLYISKNTDNSGAIPQFTYSSPRLSGEGVLATLDDVTVGLEIDDDNNQVIIFSGKNRVYRGFFEAGTGATDGTENFTIKPLLVAEGQGAISQELIGKIKQAIVWVNNSKELVELGQVENLPSPQSRPVSDLIQPDFNAANFTNGHLKFWRNQIFITDPTNGKMFVYDVQERFWNPPQILGVRLLSIYADILYGHANGSDETYKMFTGVNDNGNPISFKAHFAYKNHGKRADLKNFDKYYQEVFIQANTKVTVSLLYGWKGSTRITTYELDGSDNTYLETPSLSAAIGVNPLGTNPLGGQLSAGENTPLYRRFKKVALQNYFHYQARFECETDDASFQIIAHGGNVTISEDEPSKLIN